MAGSSVINWLRGGLPPALMLAGLLLLSAIGANAPAQAQSLRNCNELPVTGDGEAPSISVAPPTFLILSGAVTVGGAPAPDGIRIQARLDGTCVGTEFVTGLSGEMPTPGRYLLTIAADPREHAFDTITFHRLTDGATAAETEEFIEYRGYDIVGVIDGVPGADSRTDPQRAWGATERILDISFPALPEPEPVDVEHVVFMGRAFSPAHPMGLEGVQLLARVGDYTTDPSVVTAGGSYRIVVNPNSEDAVGRNIEFFLEGFPDDIAFETPVFDNVGGTTTLELNFPSIDLLSAEPEEPEPMMMVFGSLIYRGTVSSVSSPGGIEGVQIEARVGSAYTSAPATVGPDSQYLIVLNPSAELAPTLVGEPITFHLVVEAGGEEPLAFQQRRYVRSDEGTTEELNLVFPEGSEPSGGDCFGGSGFAASNLLLIIVPALVVMGIRIHSRLRPHRQP